MKEGTGRRRTKMSRRRRVRKNSRISRVNVKGPPVISQPYHPSGAKNQFIGAIRRVFKFINHHQFEDKMTISKSSCRVINDLVIDAFQRLLMEAQLLMVHERRRMLTSKSLDDAVKLLVRDPSFCHRFQFYGRKAVCDYFKH